MRKRLTSGVVAAVAAISLAVPATGLATKGGHPHSTKSCKVHKSKGHKGKSKNTKGKKCGAGTSTGTV